MNKTKFIIHVVFILVSDLVIAGYTIPSDLAKWQDTEISICFEKQNLDFSPDRENPNPWSIEKYKSEISQWVSKEFKRAGIHFKGWEECSENDNQSIRIGISPVDGDFTQILGVNGLGRKNNVVLYYPRENPEMWFPRFTAVHELLHALGFKHEHDRRDNTCQAFNSEPEFQDGLYLGKYDESSIMNYCTYDSLNLSKNIYESLETDKIIGAFSNDELEVVKTFFFGPLAELANPIKSKTTKKEISLKVIGKNIDGHYYNIGQDIDCSKISDYKIGVNGNPISYTHDEEGTYKLCLLGMKGDKTQPINAYTSYEWNYVKSDINLKLKYVMLFKDVPAPLIVESEDASTFFLKIVSSENKSSCYDKEEYKELNTDSKSFLPKKYLVDQVRSSFKEFDNYTICATSDIKNINASSLFKKEVYIGDKPFFVVNVPESISPGDIVEVYPSTHEEAVLNYSFKLVEKENQCSGKFDQVNSIEESIEFIATSESNFLCVSYQDKKGNWTKDREHFILPLNLDAD